MSVQEADFRKPLFFSFLFFRIMKCRTGGWTSEKTCFSLTLYTVIHFLVRRYIKCFWVSSNKVVTLFFVRHTGVELNAWMFKNWILSERITPHLAVMRTPMATFKICFPAFKSKWTRCATACTQICHSPSSFLFFILLFYGVFKI